MKPRLVAAAAAGYLLGSVPVADLVARRASGGTTDLRREGTGNPGAVNAMAVLGKRWGYAILAGDIAKGVAAAVLGGRLAGDAGAHLGGSAAVVGHCYPAWSRFRGGKGVAASCGQCLATFPAYFPLDVLVALAVARWRQRTFPATALASAVWVGAGVVWWKRGWPNAWGPDPTGWLPLSAAISSVSILSRFVAAPPEMTIAVVTDSNSQIPPSLVERFGIAVVPLPVTVDGRTYLEGVDLDADDFYARFETGTPTVATAQPSPGQFAAVYDRLVAGGAEEIISVHIGTSVSGTINSARLAAAEIAVPVRIVDTGTASFAIALCTWAAAEAVAGGATSEEAATAAEATAAEVGNVFVVRALELARLGGRLEPGASATGMATGIPVLSMEGGVMHVLGQAGDLDQVADVMADHVRRGGHDLRVGIGVADAGVAHLWDALEQRLAGAPEVREVVRYRVGPSVGVHTGPGTAGAMYAPATAFGPRRPARDR